jgi:phosphoglucomutase
MNNAKEAPARFIPLAGKATPLAMLVDVHGLVTAYYAGPPDFSVHEQRVAFGTSEHRRGAIEDTFNQGHVQAISRAICGYRKWQWKGGPLFLGIDTHALSVPACASALEVLGADGVGVMLADQDEYTPTPAIPHAILAYKRGRDTGLGDDTVITPSDNPPDNSVFKCNPPSGGPAETGATGWIEAKANDFLGRKLYEVPVGHNWFVNGFLDGSLRYGGEESAGASFVPGDGGVCTTDKDGIVPALPSAEITARMGRDPGEIYCELAREFGDPVCDRVEAPITPRQKLLLAQLSPQQIPSSKLAGEGIETIHTHAPDNSASIGDLKVNARSGWFAARPSGTEDMYKIYAERFRRKDHRCRILAEPQATVDAALTVPSRQPDMASRADLNERP